MKKFEDVYLKMLNENINAETQDLNINYDELCNTLNLRLHNLYAFIDVTLYLMEEAKKKAVKIYGNAAELTYDEHISTLKEFQDFSRVMYRFFETDQDFETDTTNKNVVAEDITGQNTKTYTASELKSLFIRNFVNFCKMYKLDPAENNDTFTVCKNAAQELFKMYKPALT